MNEISPLAGLRILVVEDVYLVAEVICDQLADCGCEIVGPAAQLQPALALAQEERLDGAVLDVNLNGEASFPIGDVLRARGVPYVFLTGYDDRRMFPAAQHETPRLGKPFRQVEFLRFLTEHLIPRTPSKSREGP